MSSGKDTAKIYSLHAVYVKPHDPIEFQKDLFLKNERTRKLKRFLNKKARLTARS